MKIKHKSSLFIVGLTVATSLLVSFTIAAKKTQSIEEEQIYTEKKFKKLKWTKLNGKKKSLHLSNFGFYVKRVLKDRTVKLIILLKNKGLGNMFVRDVTLNSLARMKNLIPDAGGHLFMILPMQKMLRLL